MALALRIAGLNQDVDDGKVYHPDTPKQVAAIERYMDGDYAFETGHEEYDGYAYGSSMILAQVAKFSCTVGSIVADWMGFNSAEPCWSRQDLYILFRFYNALLSALAVFVLWTIILRLSNSSPLAFVAAGLLALSTLARIFHEGPGPRPTRKTLCRRDP